MLPGSRTLADCGLLGSLPTAAPTLLPCLLVTLEPTLLGDVEDEYSPGSEGDRVIGVAAVKAAVEIAGKVAWIRGAALAIRTLPNGAEKTRGE